MDNDEATDCGSGPRGGSPAVPPESPRSNRLVELFKRIFAFAISREPSFWQASCAIALVINAVAQYPILRGQLENATNATELAKTSLESVQRAFIVPGTPSQGPDGRFTLVWTNQGNTTARAVEYRLNSKLAASLLPEDYSFFDEPSGTNGRLVLAPRNSDTAFAAGSVTPQELEDVKNEKRFLYVWGWVRYRDLFVGTPEHITMTCFRITIKGQPLLQGAGGMTTFIGLAPCEENNHHRCADEECDGKTYGNGLTWIGKQR